MTTVATTAPAPTAALAAPPAWRRLLTLARHALEASLIWLLLLAAWLAAARYLPLGHNPLIPAPDVTLRALVESLPELWTGTLSSFSILLPGFGLACLLGIASGLAVGSSPRLQRMSLPFARVAAPVPPTVYIPYAIAVLPTFKLSAIFVVFIGAFWPIFQNSAAGAHALEARWRDNARILGLTGWAFQRQVVFPAALPHIFPAWRSGWAFLSSCSPWPSCLAPTPAWAALCSITPTLPTTRKWSPAFCTPA